MLGHCNICKATHSCMRVWLVYLGGHEKFVPLILDGRFAGRLEFQFVLQNRIPWTAQSQSRLKTYSKSNWTKRATLMGSARLPVTNDGEHSPVMTHGSERMPVVAATSDASYVSRSSVFRICSTFWSIEIANTHSFTSSCFASYRYTGMQSTLKPQAFKHIVYAGNLSYTSPIPIPFYMCMVVSICVTGESNDIITLR